MIDLFVGQGWALNLGLMHAGQNHYGFILKWLILLNGKEKNAV